MKRNWRARESSGSVYRHERARRRTQCRGGCHCSDRHRPEADGQSRRALPPAHGDPRLRTAHRAGLPPRSATPTASGARAMSGPPLGWCRVAVSQVRSATRAASPSAVKGGFGCCGCEAANVMLTRAKRALKLKDWALEIAARSWARRARAPLPCTPCSGTAPSSARPDLQPRPRSTNETGDRNPSSRAGATPEGGSRRWRGCCGMRPAKSADCGFNQATLHPADPMKCHPSTQRTKAPEGRRPGSGNRQPPLIPLENGIHGWRTAPLPPCGRFQPGHSSSLGVARREQPRCREVEIDKLYEIRDPPTGALPHGPKAREGPFGA